MGIVSFIYSSKHAKAYKRSETDLQKIEEEKREREKKELRVEELLKILEDNLITQDEFNLLRECKINCVNLKK